MRRFAEATRLQRMLIFAAVILCVLDLVQLAGPYVRAYAQNPVPYPGALRNHPFAKA